MHLKGVLSSLLIRIVVHDLLVEMAGTLAASTHAKYFSDDASMSQVR